MANERLSGRDTFSNANTARRDDSPWMRKHKEMARQGEAVQAVTDQLSKSGRKRKTGKRQTGKRGGK